MMQHFDKVSLIECLPANWTELQMPRFVVVRRPVDFAPHSWRIVLIPSQVVIRHNLLG